MEGIGAGEFILDEVEGEELARRLTTLARTGEMDGPEWHALQAELTRRRVQAARQAPAPPGESLRSRVLVFLAEAPGSTPSQISGQLRRSTTVISRVLTILLDEGLVTFTSDPDDGRFRHYRLTDAGSVPSDDVVVPPSAAEEERQYLGLVIAAAVRARRRKNHLQYAIDRLERVLTQATKANANDLALVARRELATTLRQAGRLKDLNTHLEAFAAIAAGTDHVEPHLVAPAAACLDYELGRQKALPERERLEHYIAAATAFRRCQSFNGANDWAPREGWALLGSAELWRQQTEFGTALALAERAEAIFVDYDDTYGSAEATRIQGFCQRLRGNFNASIPVLERANNLARASSAKRSRADILLQWGDALRCIGEFDRATEVLDEAVELAKALDRPRTLGFCYTSLSAVEHAIGNYDQAWKLATEASTFITPSEPGRALNTRRLGVIARDLADNTDQAMLRVAREHFREALEEYSKQQSPAGLAACYIGLGKTPEGEAAIGGLVSVASSGIGRLLLPIDPWIPALLRQWADQTAHSDIKKVAEWTWRSDAQLKVADADEMAGEPRVKSGLLGV